MTRLYSPSGIDPRGGPERREKVGIPGPAGKGASGVAQGKRCEAIVGSDGRPGGLATRQ